MKIYFTRHTEADDDRRDSFGGIADDALIDSGRAYAQKLADIYQNKNIQAIYTSPYLRAKETAEIINKKLGAEIVELYNLRERNSYGVLSGIEKSLAPKMFPEIYKRLEQMKKDGVKPSTSVETLPGGEIYLELALRIRDAFNAILRDSSRYENVVVVTHGGVAWAFLKEFFNIDKLPEKGEVIVIDSENINELTINKTETEAINELIK